MDDEISHSVQPLASLSALPIETKTLIVQYAFLQDESYKERKDSRDVISSGLTVAVLRENKWRGRSLNALFLVNNCFSNLCAVYLFQNSEKLKRKFFTYKHLIAPRRGHLVKKIMFYGQDKDQLRDLLSLAHGFPNVQHLELRSSNLQLLLGDLSTLGNSGDEELDELYHSFKRLAGKISLLVLDRFSISDSSAVIGIFSVLKSLCIHHLGISSPAVEEQESIRSLGVVLSNYPLDHLSLLTPAAFVVPDSWLDLVWVSSTTLTSLVIAAAELNTTSLHLISKFSSSLERITLKAAMTVFDPEFSFLESFGNLTMLTLELGSSNQTNWALKLFSGSPLVGLVVEVEGWANDGELISVRDNLVRSLPLYPTLRNLTICDRFIRQEVYSPLVHLCASLEINIKFTHWETQYVGSQYQDDGWPFDSYDKLLFYEQALVSALNYGERKLLTLKKEEDVEGMKEMFENCKWLRASAAEMMD